VSFSAYIPSDYEEWIWVLTCDRQYFIPAAQDEEKGKSTATERGESTADVKPAGDASPNTIITKDEPEPDTKPQTEDASSLPNLPDVPTKEPALPGEPEIKKLKLSQ
jgi:hypothetical protein